MYRQRAAGRVRADPGRRLGRELAGDEFAWPHETQHALIADDAHYVARFEAIADFLLETHAPAAATLMLDFIGRTRQ
jgi:hypothetical protein